MFAGRKAVPRDDEDDGTSEEEERPRRRRRRHRKARQSSSTTTTGELIQRVNLLSATAGLPPLNATIVTASSTVPPNLIGGLTQSLINLAQRDYPTYNVAVRVSLPLRNRTAEANLGSSLAQGNRLMNQRAQSEQMIEAEVRNATQSLRSAEARLAAAAAARSSRSGAQDRPISSSCQKRGLRIGVSE